MPETLYECIDCGCEFTESEFNDVDFEIDESSPRCLKHQEAYELRGRRCTNDDNPAFIFVGSTPYCEECYKAML